MLTASHYTPFGQARQSGSLQALLFLEEMASILLTPFILYYSLPRCASAIVSFAEQFSQHVDGLGDVCSMAAFDLKQHGNHKYGSPFQGAKVTLHPHLTPPLVSRVVPSTFSMAGVISY
jgi:hypothetical protein